MTRECYVCHLQKDLDDIINQKGQLLDKGYICRNCNRIRYRERRERNIEVHKKKEQKYYQTHKSEIKAKRKQYAINNGHKIKARYMVMVQVKNGIVIRPKFCSVCDKPCIPDAHHEDYLKPLDVVWLCRKCHQIKHNGK